MINVSIRPEELNLPTQQRMASHALQLLRTHPLVAPILSADAAFLVSFSTRALSVSAVLPGNTNEELVACLDYDRWWLPERSGRALAMAEELARKLRAGWDQRAEPND
jgi:hypothetical protein